jgi:hypothetical protein
VSRGEYDAYIGGIGRGGELRQWVVLWWVLTDGTTGRTDLFAIASTDIRRVFVNP